MKNILIDVRDKQELLYSKCGQFTQDFIECYKDSRHYLTDAIGEYADGSISIYTSDQQEYYYNHKKSCNRAVQEFCILETFNPETDDLDDLITRAGAAGWFSDIENDLYSDMENILLGLVYAFIVDMGIYYITPEQHKEIIEAAKNYLYENDKINNIKESTRLYIDKCYH